MLENNLTVPYYFEQGKTKDEKIRKLIQEIDIDLWDALLLYNYDIHTIQKF